jgi:hypothetical protein
MVVWARWDDAEHPRRHSHAERGLEESAPNEANAPNEAMRAERGHCAERTVMILGRDTPPEESGCHWLLATSAIRPPTLVASNQWHPSLLYDSDHPE